MSTFRQDILDVLEGEDTCIRERSYDLKNMEKEFRSYSNFFVKEFCMIKFLGVEKSSIY